MALFIVSNGCDAIIVASNTIFNLKNKNYFVRRLKAFLLTVVLVMLFTFMLIVPVFGEQILTMLTHIGFNNKIIDVLKMLYPVLNIPLSLFVMYLGIKCIFIIFQLLLTSLRVSKLRHTEQINQMIFMHKCLMLSVLYFLKL